MSRDHRPAPSPYPPMPVDAPPPDAAHRTPGLDAEDDAGELMFPQQRQRDLRAPPAPAPPGRTPAKNLRNRK